MSACLGRHIEDVPVERVFLGQAVDKPDPNQLTLSDLDNPSQITPFDLTEGVEWSFYSSPVKDQTTRGRPGIRETSSRTPRGRLRYQVHIGPDELKGRDLLSPFFREAV